MSEKQKGCYMHSEILEQPEVVGRVVSGNLQAIQDLGTLLRSRIDSGEIDSVVLVARGSSDNAAFFGKYVLEMTTGLPVALAAPSVVNLYRADMRYSKALVIGVSQSGQTNEIVSYMEAVKARCNYTLGITNDPDSDLAMMGLDRVFLCQAGEERSVAATKTFMSTAVLFWLLAAAISTERQETMICEVQLLPDKLASAIKLEPQVEDIAGWLAPGDECILLARGMSYPLAMEMALKLQETALVRAKAFSGGDFQHGPMAITEKGLRFVALLPADATYEGMRLLCESVAEKGGEVRALIGPRTDHPLLAKIPALEVDMDSTTPLPLPMIVVGQLLAYHCSILRGLDPDAPRWLSKVTATV